MEKPYLTDHLKVEDFLKGVPKFVRLQNYDLQLRMAGLSTMHVDEFIKLG